MLRWRLEINHTIHDPLRLELLQEIFKTSNESHRDIADHLCVATRPSNQEPKVTRANDDAIEFVESAEPFHKLCEREPRSLLLLPKSTVKENNMIVCVLHVEPFRILVQNNIEHVQQDIERPSHELNLRLMGFPAMAPGSTSVRKLRPRGARRASNL